MKKNHNIIQLEKYIQDSFIKEKYNPRFKQFNIYSSWWSKRKTINLTYRKFLQLSWIFKKSPSALLEKSASEDTEKFLEMCDSNEKITKFIKATKYVMKTIFKEKKLKKTTFLENIYDERIDISRKTINRVLNNEEHLEFFLKTFLIILEGLNTHYNDFFKKIYEVINNGTNNSNRRKT